jgi:regulator of sirC expression with transglutaminase-like and TPR domain
VDTTSGNRHWSQERFHADVQRAVGGVVNLLREVSRISHHLEPSIPAEWMLKRVQFFSYELQTLTRDAHTDQDKLGLLNNFFFSAKNFRCTPLGEVRLNRVLAERTGAPQVIELLYAFLAERIGVALDFVDLKPTCFLRWSEGGRSRYIDVTRGGATLSSDELIDTLHTRFSMTTFSNTSLLEVASFESYISDYLVTLKHAIDISHDPETVLFLQDTLIAYQPSNLQLVGERALLHRRLGNFKNAFTDLKRYFSFHDRSRAPIELCRLLDELTELYERTKSNVEIID